MNYGMVLSIFDWWIFAHNSKTPIENSGMAMTMRLPQLVDIVEAYCDKIHKLHPAFWLGIGTSSDHTDRSHYTKLANVLKQNIVSLAFDELIPHLLPWNLCMFDKYWWEMCGQLLIPIHWYRSEGFSLQWHTIVGVFLFFSFLFFFYFKLIS